MRNLVLSTQGINAEQACPRLYSFSHVLRKTAANTPKYFTEGIFLHYILEQYYLARKAGNPNIDQIIRLARDKALTTDLTIQETEDLINLFKEYIQFHSGDEWEILEVEKPFARVIWEDAKLDLRIVFKGKIDLRIQNRQGIRILIDHKKIGRNVQVYERDNQILGYCWAFDDRDFIINQLGTQKSLAAKDKFKRQYFNITSHAIDEWIEETIYTAFEIVKFHSNNVFPAKIKACQSMGRRCTFYDVCKSEKSNWEYLLSNGGQFKDSEEFDIMGSEIEE